MLPDVKSGFWLNPCPLYLGGHKSTNIKAETPKAIVLTNLSDALLWLRLWRILFSLKFTISFTNFRFSRLIYDASFIIFSYGCADI